MQLFNTRSRLLPRKSSTPVSWAWAVGALGIQGLCFEIAMAGIWYLEGWFFPQTLRGLIWTQYCANMQLSVSTRNLACSGLHRVQSLSHMASSMSACDNNKGVDASSEKACRQWCVESLHCARRSGFRAGSLAKKGGTYVRTPSLVFRMHEARLLDSWDSHKPRNTKARYQISASQ